MEDNIIILTISRYFYYLYAKFNRLLSTLKYKYLPLYQSIAFQNKIIINGSINNPKVFIIQQKITYS